MGPSQLHMHSTLITWNYTLKQAFRSSCWDAFSFAFWLYWIVNILKHAKFSSTCKNHLTSLVYTNNKPGWYNDLQLMQSTCFVSLGPYTCCICSDIYTISIVQCRVSFPLCTWFSVGWWMKIRPRNSWYYQVHIIRYRVQAPLLHLNTITIVTQ